MTAVSYKLKTLIVLSFLLTWAVVAAAHVFSYAVRKREPLLRAARSIAWREARIPARRGRLLDRNGVPLAFDRLHGCLLLESWPTHSRRADALRQLLTRDFPRLQGDPKEWRFPVPLRDGIAPGEIPLLNKKYRRFPEIRVSGRFVRRTDPDPAVGVKVGRTAVNDRQDLVGVSGWEQQYDLELSGKPGRLTVMLDRGGNWVFDTLRVTRRPEDGRDVRLNVSREELRGGHEK